MSARNRSNAVAFSLLLATCGPALAQDRGPLAEDPLRRPAVRNAPVEQAVWAEPAAQSRALPARTRSASTSEAATPRRASGTESGALWVTATIVGITFLGLALASRWLKTNGPARFRALPSEALELLGKRTLEPRVTVHLVRCGGRILMLGAGPDGVRTLAEYTDPVEVDLLAGACRRPEEASGLPAFAPLFAKKARTTTPVAATSPLQGFELPPERERTHA